MRFHLVDLSTSYFMKGRLQTFHPAPIFSSFLKQIRLFMVDPWKLNALVELQRERGVGKEYVPQNTCALSFLLSR